MKKIFLLGVLLCLSFTANASQTDLVEESIKTMINNVTDYTLEALWEQKQQEWIDNLIGLEKKTLALKEKILLMQQTDTTKKYLSLIETVLSSIKENKAKLELSLKNKETPITPVSPTPTQTGNTITPPKTLSGLTIEVKQINVIPAKKRPENLRISDEKAFSCADLGNYVTKNISAWSAWNSCGVQWNQIAFFTLDIANDTNGSYNYSLHILWFDEWLAATELVESGTGVTKSNILEKNIELSEQAKYKERIKNIYTSQTPALTSNSWSTSSGAIIIPPTSQTLSGSITSNYTWEKVGCESVQSLANERYNWAAWNTCNNMNWVLSFNVLWLVDQAKQSYIYEKHTINFNTKTYTIKFLESWSGVNKDNFIQKNKELKTKVFP